MATDSTDLAFVRCPSCRSLVPAVSTKCRMCGAGLEAGGQDSNTPPAASSGADKGMGGTAQANPHEPPPQPVASQNVDAEKDVSDPLAAYLDSLPDDDEMDDFDDIDEIDDEMDDFDDIEEDFDDIAEEDEGESYQASEPAAPEATPAPKQPEPAPQPVEAKKETPQKSEAKKEEKPRVVIEQGKSRQSGRSFSFSKNKEEEKKPAPAPAKRAEPAQPARNAAPQEQKKQEEFVEPAHLVEEEPREEVLKAKTQPAKAPLPPKVETRKDSPKWTEAKSEGKLFGWLVSYADSQGASLELREGRFFVTAQELRQGDLVLDQDSISTPHAMFTISGDTGIQVQDLRSDRGVFVREQDSAYRREYDTADLHHGDWIRFGDVEFLVCLIAV